MGAFEGIALVVAGAFLKWVSEMASDRARKSDEIDKGLAAEESKIKEKIAELDKANSTAIATLTAGVEHIVRELAGIRSDMKDHRIAVFTRIDRNEEEMKEIKSLAEKTVTRLEAIEAKVSDGGRHQ